MPCCCPKFCPGGGSEQAAALCQDKQMLDAGFQFKNHSGMVQLLLAKLEKKQHVWDVLQECKRHSMCVLSRS